jgi:hypothetical protein
MVAWSTIMCQNDQSLTIMHQNDESLGSFLFRFLLKSSNFSEHCAMSSVVVAAALFL